jgi:predicted enzyme related to lactoylglutathione lyase
MTKIDSQKRKHEQIQYIEFLSGDIARSKKFHSKSFGWTFTGYGPDYSALEGIMSMAALRRKTS